MKKALISIVFFMLLASVTILFVNATDRDKDRKTRKAKTEIRKESGKCEMAGCCKMAADNKKACCDSVKEMKGAMKGCCSAKSEASCPKMVQKSKE